MDRAALIYESLLRQEKLLAGAVWWLGVIAGALLVTCVLLGVIAVRCGR